MPAEVISLQELLKVVGQANSVEFNNTILELLNATRMHIPVRDAHGVDVVEAQHDRVHDLEDLLSAQLLLSERLPLTYVTGTLHFNENQLVCHDPIFADFNQVWMAQFRKHLDLSDGFAALVPIERANVNAGHHRLFPCLMVFNHENLTVAVLVI